VVHGTGCVLVYRLVSGDDGETAAYVPVYTIDVGASVDSVLFCYARRVAPVS
jgi:hypothetical protein